MIGRARADPISPRNGPIHFSECKADARKLEVQREALAEEHGEVGHGGFRLFGGILSCGHDIAALL